MLLKNLSINEMFEQAKSLAQQLNKKSIILLEGDLGAGKTTFAGQIINAMSTKEMQVTSPTFNIISVYEFDNKEIWHFDLYRITNKMELFEIGIEEAFENAISIIEWPQIAMDLIPKEHIHIELKISQENQDLRDITINYKG